MRRTIVIGLLVAGAWAVAGGDQGGATFVEPKADEMLRRMSACLAGAKSFAFDVHSTAEELDAEGQAIVVARNQKVSVSRPNCAAATVTGDRERFQFYYDGSKAVLFNPEAGAYAELDAPPTLDETFDLLATEYGLTVPLADLVFADPYKVLTEKVKSGRYVGMGYVFDVPCHQIACTQEAVDWQIWIDTGERPLPRKVAITYKLLPGQPRYTAFLSNWDLSADAAESKFSFTPPSGAKRVPWLAPATRPAADAPAAGGPRRKGE